MDGAKINGILNAMLKLRRYLNEEKHPAKISGLKRRFYPLTRLIGQSGCEILRHIQNPFRSAQFT
jgi:hypothetical protein